MPARTRSTPYRSQLTRWLHALDGAPRTFSARTLADEFDVPRRERLTTTVGQIHKALQRAFADGAVIAFVDDTGRRLREEQYTTSGSAAVEHPYIFATPGTPSPDPDYRPATYEETLAMPSAEPAEDATVIDDAGKAPVQSDSDDGGSDATVDGERGGLLMERLAEWGAEAPAPEWLPSELLRMWVALAPVQARWRAGLAQAPMPERLVLIRAGVKRKGEFTAGSITAGLLADLCREKPGLWEQCARGALKHYLQSGEALEPEALPAFVDDPLAFDDTHEGDGAVLALAGAMLDLDADAMELLAAGAVEGIAEAQADALEARLRHRAEALQAELDELREEMRGQQEATQRAEGEATRLRQELERLREGEQRAGSIDEQLAAERAARQHDLSRIAELEASMARAEEDRDRARELTARLESAEQAHVELAAVVEQLARERELRAEAEAQVQEEIRRTRDLTAQLRAAAEAGVRLPVEDADALLRALGRPIGQAAGHAANRLACGQAEEGDQRLLQLAAAYGQLASELPAQPSTADGEPREVSAPDTPEATVEPTPVEATAPQPTPAELPAEESIDEVSPPAEAAPVASPPEAGDGTSADQPAAPVRRRPRPERSSFTVRAIGGAEEIGGSAILVQSGDASVLLDAGQRVKNEYGGWRRQ